MTSALLGKFQTRSTVYTPPANSSAYTKDAEGYSRVPVGGFNVCNRAGDFYPAKVAVPQILGQVESTLGRYLSDGALYGEIDHPPLTDFMIPNVSQRVAMARWLQRLKILNPKLFSHHIKKFDLEVAGDGDWANEANEVRVWAWTLPFGPYKDMLEKSFSTPSINTYFSLRSIVQPEVRPNMRYMHMHDICTYDAVPYGGKEKACKHKVAAGLNGAMGIYDDGMSISFEIDHLELARELCSQSLGQEGAKIAMSAIDRLLDKAYTDRDSRISQLNTSGKFNIPNSGNIW